MEEYEGVAILATNLRQNIDDAFMRRLRFIVDFPFPDEEHRRADLAAASGRRERRSRAGRRLRAPGAQLRISGGNIKNIVLNAAFLAAAAEQAIGMQHLLRATRREFQKMGKVLSADLEQVERRRGCPAQEGAQP